MTKNLENVEPSVALTEQPSANFPQERFVLKKRMDEIDFLKDNGL
jgi:hypothetical protein